MRVEAKAYSEDSSLWATALRMSISFTGESLVRLGGMGALCVAVGACTGASGPEPQFPSPMEESVRAHERVEATDRPGRDLAIRGVLPVDVTVFVPISAPDTADLLVHFHGAEYLVRDAVAGIEPQMIGVTVNLGSGSAVYERPLSAASNFELLLDSIRTHVRFGRVFLSSWSAGYGAVRAILRGRADRVDGILLLDGLHTDYVPYGTRLSDGGRLNAEKMEPFRRFAARAAAGSRAMIVTHSEIFPGTYASTTETAAWLADTLGIEQIPVLRWGPHGMQQLSEAASGRLAILGFAGNTAPDHVDHVHAIAPMLRRLVSR